MALPNELLAAAGCFACETPYGWKLMQAALYREALLAVDPMAQTDPASLLDSAKCYACEAPGELQLIQVELLRRTLLALDPGAQTDPASLLDDAKCFACYANSPAFMELMQLVLLNSIANSLTEP